MPHQTKSQKEKLKTVQETNNQKNGYEVMENLQVTPKVTSVITPKSTPKGTREPVITRNPVTKEPRHVTQMPHTEAPKVTQPQPHTEVPKVTQPPHTEPPKATKQPVQDATSLQIPGMLQLGKGRSVALPIEITPASAEISISSSNTNVVRVQGTTLQAQQEGRCDIRVKSGNLIRTCTIKVTEE